MQVGEGNVTFIGDKNMWTLYVDTVTRKCHLCNVQLKAGESYHLNTDTDVILCTPCYEKQQQNADQPELTRCSGCGEKMKIIRTLIRLLSEILEDGK